MRQFLHRLMGRRPQLLKYSDVFDVMRYQAPGDLPAGSVPDIHAFRIKDGVASPDPRPSFAFLETADEVSAWHLVMAGNVEVDGNRQITDRPLLQWNEIPSLLTSDTGMVMTCLPEDMDSDWPPLAVQTLPFGARVTGEPVRDRYHFEQNKFIAVF